jgi:hypothetical protein
MRTILSPLFFAPKFTKKNFYKKGIQKIYSKIYQKKFL